VALGLVALLLAGSIVASVLWPPKEQPAAESAAPPKPDPPAQARRSRLP
jgi:hypothetical protein